MAALGEPGDDRLLRLRARQAVELAGVDEHLVVGVGDERGALLDLAVRRPDDGADLQPVLLRERVVALVVGGDGHDRAGAVLHQHVVGDPDRDLLAVDGVDGVAAGEDAVLLLLLALDRRACPGVAHVLAHLLGVGQLRDEGVLGRQHEEGGAEERVRPRREDRQLLAGSGDAEDHARALGAADPVALHRQDALGPVLEQVHLVEQRVGVVGDLEEPLGQVLRLDLGAAALAVAVDHLLVREHGLVDRAPLDRRLLAVGEAALEEAEEEPLRPAVVLGLVRRELAVPVDRPAHAVHLPADRGDVALGDDARMPALADRGVLGGQAERVVAHRPQHAEAAPAAEVGDDVADRVVEDVPHVQLARRVRQHLDDVRLGALGLAGLGVRRVKAPRVLPDALPALLDLSRLVPLCHLSLGHLSLRVQKSLSLERPWEARVASPRSLLRY